MFHVKHCESDAIGPVLGEDDALTLGQGLGQGAAEDGLQLRVLEGQPDAVSQGDVVLHN